MFWKSISFHNLMSSVSSMLESLHDLIMIWLIVILMVVMIVGWFSLNNSASIFMKKESTLLEVTWTVIPILILSLIALPSLFLLNKMETLLPFNTLKVISNQWNWQSEYNDQVDHLLDAEKIDELGNYESPVILPSLMKSRILLTSSDVLHSLGVPALGLKLDSTPGRLSAVSVDPSSVGLLLGSCYELCGSGHSAMPIFLFIS